MYKVPSMFGGSRQTETHMSCKKCKGELRVIRACREVYVFCNKCGGKFPLDSYLEYLDDIEDFMDNIPCDRI